MYVNPKYNTEGGNNTTDKIFLLSIAEAKNTSYGFTYSTRSTDTRKSQNTAYVYGGGHTGTSSMNGVGEADYWWLRSPGNESNCAANVYDDGELYEYGNNVEYSYYAVRPAFNLNLSSVLFTSAAKGGKAGTTGTLSANADLSTFTDNDGYKLTLKDESRNFSVTDTSAKITGTGEKLSFTYSNAATGTNEYISAMIINSNNEVLYYGQLANVTSASDTVEFVVPSDIALGAYTLKLFNEQINGDYKTDYASDFIDITLNILKLNADGYCEISNADELLLFAELVNAGNNSVNAVLTADIDLENRAWTPIADYAGIFNGGGKTVKGLNVQATGENQGFFGHVSSDGTVKDFIVYGDITITGASTSVGVVGKLSGTVSGVTSYVNIVVADDTVSGSYAYFGGVVGVLLGGTVEQSVYYGNINTKSTGVDQTGGIVAYVDYGTGGTINNCGYYGNITSVHVGTPSIGGIIGYSRSSKLNMTNCLSVGTFTLGENTNNTHVTAFGVINAAPASASNLYYLVGSAPKGTINNGYDYTLPSGTITTVDETKMKSGEVAYLLGVAWGQTIGTDDYPVIGGEIVCLNDGVYYNLRSFRIVSHAQNDTKTDVKLEIPEAGTYSLIIADYEDSRLKDVEILTQSFEKGVVTKTSTKDFTLGAGDKIMLWSDMTNLVPKCEAYVVK